MIKVLNHLYIFIFSFPLFLLHEPRVFACGFCIVGMPRQAIRAQLRSDRYFPNPLGIVLLYDIGFLFCGKARQPVRAQLRSDRHFPNPLGIVLLYDIGFL